MVTIEAAPDPEAPHRTIRRARRLTMADRLHAEGMLSTEQREAATRYAAAFEVAALGLTSDPAAVRGYVHPAWRSHAPEMVTAALARLRQADQALGLMGQAVLRLVVCADEAPETAYRRLWPAAPAVSIVVARNRVAGALAAALDRLVEAGWD